MIENLSSCVVKRPGHLEVNGQTREALAMYYGGEALSQMILRFSGKEPDEKYAWRVDATIDAYENYPQEIFQSYIESIKKAGVVTRTFSTKESEENDYLKDQYSAWFDSEFCPPSLTLPEVYVQVCLPKAESPEEILTEADKKEAELKPYPVIVFPDNVLNVVIGLDGEVERITIAITKETSLLYDETNCYEIKQDGEVVNIVSTTPHGFTECPFVRVLWRENKCIQGEPKPGQSMMFNVIKKSKSAMLFSSMLIEAAYYHLHPQLITDVETAKNIVKDGMGVNSIIKEGENTDGLATRATRYLEKSNSEIEKLDMLLHERIPQVIYRSARLRDHSTIQTNQSGVSKAFDMVPEVAVLTEIANYWKKADERIVRLLAIGYGFEPDNITITYPKVFQVKTTAEVLKEVTDFTVTMDKSSLPQSKKANEEISMRMYKQLLPDLEDADYLEIKDEIEADSEEMKKEGTPTEALMGQEPTNLPPMNGKPPFQRPMPNGGKVMA